MLILGVFIGATLGVLVHGLFSVNAYEKGYEDGRSGR